MNTAEYQNILGANLIISVKNFELLPDWIFPKDNDPKHIAKSTKK